MRFPMKPVFRRWSLLVLYILILNLCGLGRHGLLEPDEGRYANMALEILEPEHDWLEPTLSDVAHFDKPPLIYWMTGLSFSIFGVNETAARFPSFLGSLMALAGVALIAFRIYGERAAWWGVLVGATTLQFWALARLLSPDMLLCGLCTLAAGCCLSAGGGSRSWWWAAGAGLWTLAWWDKATACLVPLLALALSLHFTGRRDLLANLRPFRLLLVIIVLGSPWYLLMMERHEELKSFFFHRELAGRVIGHVDGRRGFPGFHFVAAIGLWLPWWPFALAKIATLPEMKGSRSWMERLRAVPFEFVAAFLVLVIFSLISSKLLTYTLTGVPWLAAGLGAAFKYEKFSLKGPKGLLLLSGAAFVGVVVFFLPKYENQLGVNSSTRKVIEVSKRMGAKTWVCDRFLPGIEFYGGESVYFLETPDQVQVSRSSGQAPGKHFKTRKDLAPLIECSGAGTWFVQSKPRVPDWEESLLAKHALPGSEPVAVGGFRLWRLK